MLSNILGQSEVVALNSPSGLLLYLNSSSPQCIRRAHHTKHKPRDAGQSWHTRHASHKCSTATSQNRIGHKQTVWRRDSIRALWTKLQETATCCILALCHWSAHRDSAVLSTSCRGNYIYHRPARQAEGALASPEMSYVTGDIDKAHWLSM
jgi:hypothetical protein